MLRDKTTAHVSSAAFLERRQTERKWPEGDLVSSGLCVSSGEISKLGRETFFGSSDSGAVERNTEA